MNCNHFDMDTSFRRTQISGASAHRSMHIQRCLLNKPVQKASLTCWSDGWRPPHVRETRFDFMFLKFALQLSTPTRWVTTAIYRIRIERQHLTHDFLWSSLAKCVTADMKSAVRRDCTAPNKQSARRNNNNINSMSHSVTSANSAWLFVYFVYCFQYQSNSISVQKWSKKKKLNLKMMTTIKWE